MRPLRWIRAHPWRTAAIATVLVMVADYNLASYADKRIRARDADFYELYRPDEIDWSNSDYQNCRYKRELLLYYYRVCLFVSKYEGVTRFLYWRPLPVFYGFAWMVVDF